MGAESTDFFFDCWYLKVITDDGIMGGGGYTHEPQGDIAIPIFSEYFLCFKKNKRRLVR
jgi:hypothetical protein